MSRRINDAQPKSIVLKRFGDPEVFSFEPVHLGTLADQSIQIQVKAAGINFADIMMRMGLYPDAPKLPCIPGYEVSGIIDQIGEKVQNFQRGDRVMAITRFGGYASVIQTPQEYVRKIPDALSFEKAAAIPVNYLTAWAALFALAKIKKNDVIFIHHIMGGVGLAATQLAKMMECSVLGTTGSHEKIAKAKEFNIDYVFHYLEKNFVKECRRFTQGKGVQVVLDATGGKNLKKDLLALAPTGAVILFGASSMVTGRKRSFWKAGIHFLTSERISPFWLISQNRGIYGLNLLKLFNQRDLFQEGIAFLEKGLKNQLINPVVAKAFPFSEVAQAHTYIQDRKNTGKVVLTFS